MNDAMILLLARLVRDKNSKINITEAQSIIYNYALSEAIHNSAKLTAELCENKYQDLMDRFYQVL